MILRDIEGLPGEREPMMCEIIADEADFYSSGRKGYNNNNNTYNK